METLAQLLESLSRPRPNGSHACRRTLRDLCHYLDRQGIPHTLHTFRLYPFLLETFGAWIIAWQTGLALAVWLQGGWATAAIALVGALIVIVEMGLRIPLLSHLGACQSDNLAIAWAPPRPRRELILCAHYDSKTELWDHRGRHLLLKGAVLFGLPATLALGLAGPLEQYLQQTASPWAGHLYTLAAGLSIPQLLLCWSLGLNTVLGRLVRPSRGAADNGAACAIVLEAARRLYRGEVPLARTKITCALFTGEEVGMQGSRAYVRQRAWPLPAAALNLEIMGQSGGYIVWQREGHSLAWHATDPDLNRALQGAVEQVTGHPPQNRPEAVFTDAASFLQAGLPAATLSTLHPRLGDRGFHRPADEPGRLDQQSLRDGVDIVLAVVRAIDEAAAL
ncbi:MAG: M20/M25/M40 family metallo-hydrolase [Candidatus Latescibacteria bacterium]|nr:M20/M25/M40 family metallo-hydrolase [Candidatus Latescibacterota bacterium]